MKRLRLVKVLVQPVFVIDDGDTLEETMVEPETVTAADWPAYADVLAEKAALTEASLNAPADDDPDVEDGS